MEWLYCAWQHYLTFWLPIGALGLAIRPLQCLQFMPVGMACSIWGLVGCDDPKTWVWQFLLSITRYLVDKILLFNLKVLLSLPSTILTSTTNFHLLWWFWVNFFPCFCTKLSQIHYTTPAVLKFCIASISSHQITQKGLSLSGELY